ncbi:MAG: apolipoprotein N-acyltransferase [bacterium]|nr:apolipoprotein N-acyltransferase [bacterium]
MARTVTTLRLVGALLAGILLALGYPPYEWTSLAWLGLVGFVWLVATAGTRAVALWSGYLFGLAYFAVILSWLIEVELIAYYPLAMVQALAFLIAAGGIFRYRDAAPWTFVLATAGAGALAEFLRVRWPFGGFPWGSIGVMAGATPLRPSAQWIGATGWGVLLAAVAAVVVLVLRRRLSWKVLAAVAGGVVILGLAGNVWPAVPEGETRSVTIVQGNSPCPGTRCLGERRLIYESHLALTRALEPGPDLVVWPESSTGGSADPLRDPDVARAIGAEAVRLDATLLVGGDLDAGPGHFDNVNVVFGPSGAIVGTYRKRHPVPFGEYVPLRPIFQVVPALDRVPRDMVRGREQVLFDLDGVRFGSVISYEGAYARYEREAVRAGAAFLVLATNEASFGRTPASDQMIAISRMRAAELGVDLVHAAVTGKSAFVHADGRVESRTELFETTTAAGVPAARTAGPTLYVRWGDWLQVGAMLAYLGLRVAGFIRREERA